MIADAWPAPPELAGDPPSDVWMLVVAICVVAIALVWFIWLVRGENEPTRLETREELAKRLARACEEEKREVLIQWLIDNSPGGRKPWQDRRRP